MSTLVGPYSQDGRWSHPQESTLRQSYNWGKVTTEARRRGRPQLRFKDICKRDLKSCNIDTKLWEEIAADRNLWKQQVSQGLKNCEAVIRAMVQEGPEEWPATSSTNQTHDLQLLSYVKVAAETANAGLPSTATQDVVPL